MEVKCPWCGTPMEPAEGVVWVEPEGNDYWCPNDLCVSEHFTLPYEAIKDLNSRQSPWADAPDGPGWWWYAAPWSAPEEVECRVVRKRKAGDREILESYDPWQPCEPVGYEGYRTTWDICTGDYGYKWQRAIVPPPPRE